ncbi:MAG: PstS family phosphate ABC transporter substrate-binding protein [Fimbriimonas sp.]
MALKRTILVAAVAATFTLIGCGEKGSDAGSPEASKPEQTSSLSGAVAVDGSSTVGPIMSAVAEEFGKENPDVKPTVGISGTGGGFKKFANGEIDIADASRPISDKELKLLAEKGIEFIELPIAFDGISIVVNPQNEFLEDVTVAELKKIWEPDSKVTTWDQVRAGFPKETIKLYGAGTDSGTFDYFTLAINGKEKACRTDYQMSEDDNTLVQGVAGDKFALGYFGYAYYEENKDKLKLLKVNGVAPSPVTIADGTYQPLSRPLLIYVNKKSLETKPAVKAMAEYVLSHASELITSVGYVPLPEEDYAAARDRLGKMTAGTVFHGAETGIRIKDLLKRESGK